jgi:hypothetical protein
VRYARSTTTFRTAGGSVTTGCMQAKKHGMWSIDRQCADSRRHYCSAGGERRFNRRPIGRVGPTRGVSNRPSSPPPATRAVRSILTAGVRDQPVPTAMRRGRGIPPQVPALRICLAHQGYAIVPGAPTVSGEARDIQGFETATAPGRGPAAYRRLGLIDGVGFAALRSAFQRSCGRACFLSIDLRPSPPDSPEQWLRSRRRASR